MANVNPIDESIRDRKSPSLISRLRQWGQKKINNVRYYLVKRFKAAYQWCTFENILFSFIKFMVFIADCKDGGKSKQIREARTEAAVAMERAKQPEESARVAIEMARKTKQDLEAAMLRIEALNSKSAIDNDERRLVSQFSSASSTSVPLVTITPSPPYGPSYTLI